MTHLARFSVCALYEVIIPNGDSDSDKILCTLFEEL